MEKPLITIITPVYNTAPYLKEAVESVLSQTYPHWELLLVDDGSTDESGTLCDAYGERDSRIRVFHQENGGVSRARNRALKEAGGAFICFLDSDDQLEPGYLETLLAMEQAAPGCPVCCGYFALEKGREIAPARGLQEKKLHLDDFLYEMLIGNLSLPLCCVTWLLPAGQALAQTFDTDLGYGEDSLYMMKVLRSFEWVYYDPVPLYHYRTERAGNTLGEKSLKKAESIYASNAGSYGLSRGKLPRAEQVYLKHLVESGAAAARMAWQCGEKNKYHLYRKKSLQAWKKLRSCPDISRHDRIRLFGYGLAPVFSEKLMLKIYGRV